MRDWIAILGGLPRAALAAALVYFCIQDWPATLARAEFEALPDFDYAGEARSLAAQERFSEALLVLDTGLEADPADEQGVELQAAKAEVEAQRDSTMRRLGEVGQGALTGQGQSVEALTGAVVADLFVFGDIRDLVIQGSNYLKGEQTDEVIVALSAAGLMLTAAPALDLGTALLKFARRAGAMSETFARNVVKLVRRSMADKNADQLAAVAGDVATLGKRAQPAGAIAILKNIDDADELRLAARFAEQPGGAFTLWLGGKPALTTLKTAGREGEELLLRGARKGRAGLDYVAKNGAVLLRPHPLLGLFKGIYKGNVQALLAALLRAYAELLLGLAAAWLAYEVLLLGARARGRHQRT